MPALLPKLGVVKTKQSDKPEDIAQQLYNKNVELLEQRRRTEQLLYNVSEIIIALDPDYRITLLNQTSERILGIKDASEVLGTHIEDLIKLETEEDEKLNVRDYCFAQDGKDHLESVVLKTNNGDRYVNMTTSTIDFPSGKSECLVTITDITKEKMLEKVKDDFISVTSHELKTPMTIIKSYLWMLANNKAGPLNEKQMAYLEKAIRGSDRMLNLVNDMLNISRMERGKVHMEIKEINLVGVVQGVLAEMQFKADEKGLSLGIDVASGDEGLLVKADELKVMEVLTNYISNGLKYTDQGGIKVDICADGAFARVTVIDTGKGIAPEDIGKLFHKFSRLNYSYETVAEAGGTGLGLYIVKTYVERMGGHVGVYSKGVGKGSTFWFTLPLAK